MSIRAELEFARIGAAGIGDPQNSYAFSMAWFADALFVGTVRNILALVKASPPPEEARMEPWPVPVPADVFELDLGAQLMRYAPGSRTWTEAYRSPTVCSADRDGDSGTTPRDIGYRCMAVCQTKDDAAPALYVTTAASSSRGPGGAHVLRFDENGDVAVVSPPGLGDQSVSTLRTLVSTDGRLYTSPTGSGRAWNAADKACVYVTDDPAGAGWRPVSHTGFGDTSNDALYSMAEFAGHLYVGTLNPRTGYQVWKARLDEGRHRWRLVLAGGADRGNLNEAAMTMCVFGGALYVGSGISNGGYDRTYGVGPAAAEIVRIHPDDTWDLVVGQARRTRQGRQHPSSGLGPGFDNPCAGYLWSMAVHENRLYAGTFDSTIFALWAQHDRQPARVGRVEDFVADRAGAELWCSEDGDWWTPVTTGGFGNPYNYGIRTLVSTPAGLFAGTANPFGPDVAARFAGQWQYVANADGGAEVWLGTPRPPAGRVAPAHLLMKMPQHAHDAEPSPDARATRAQYDRGMYDPLIAELYDGSDFHNFGYWYRSTRTLRQASENLMEQLLVPVPDAARLVLDVGCGKGATTRHLARYIDPVGLVGINVSAKQLASCRRNVPGATFLEMDATQLNFEPGTFDAVVCVEAAMHLDTRADFLREARRVLRPGGVLTLSDVLRTKAAESTTTPAAANHLPSPEAYEDLLRRVGFRAVHVRDVTVQTWHRYALHLEYFLRRKRLRGEITPAAHDALLLFLRTRHAPAIRYYILAAGQKA